MCPRHRTGPDCMGEVKDIAGTCTKLHGFRNLEACFAEGLHLCEFAQDMHAR